MLVIWGAIAVLGAGLVLWLLTSPTAPAALGIGIGGDAAAHLQSTSTPTLDPRLHTPTPSPTRVVILATRRPGTQVLAPLTNTPNPTAPMGPFFIYPEFDPLTGLKAANPAMLERRPVAVKVSTFPRSLRPYQSGLSRADIVYEYYTEDEQTRFIAVFYSKDATKAGPVRSGRYFDENIMRMYHAVLVFASADLRVRNYFIDSPDLLPFLFLQRSDNCPPLCYDKTMPKTAGGGYNNLFVDTAGVGHFLEDNKKQFLRPGFFYGAVSSFSSQRIDHIYTHYSRISYNYWEYDPTKNKYLRYSDNIDTTQGQPEVYAAHYDHLTGQQLAADNVVELMVPHTFRDAADRADQLFDIQMYNSGTAYVFNQGYMYVGTWVRDRTDQAIQIFDQHKIPIRLQPGVTYYQVIDPESTVWQDGGRIDFTFSIPPRVLTATPTLPKPTPTRRNHK